MTELKYFVDFFDLLPEKVSQKLPRAATNPAPVGIVASAPKCPPSLQFVHLRCNGRADLTFAAAQPQYFVVSHALGPKGVTAVAPGVGLAGENRRAAAAPLMSPPPLSSPIRYRAFCKPSHGWRRLLPLPASPSFLPMLLTGFRQQRLCLHVSTHAKPTSSSMPCTNSVTATFSRPNS
jgi:hypothetical protein